MGLRIFIHIQCAQQAVRASTFTQKSGQLLGGIRLRIVIRWTRAAIAET